MSGFDISFPFGESCSMNVSLTEPMEQFVRQKAAVGEYETASEVVREALRLLRQGDEAWKADVRSKITQGMDSIRAGKTIPTGKVKTEMTTFKKKWKKDRVFNEGLRTEASLFKISLEIKDCCVAGLEGFFASLKE
jgi:antitoxin ParD1/3/4